MLMTVRERLVSVKSQLLNAFRSYAAEFGIVGAAGRQNVNALIQCVLEDETLPELALELFRFQAKEYAAIEARLAKNVFSGSRNRSGGQDRRASQTAAGGGAAVLCHVIAVPGRDGGMRFLALLGARDRPTWP